MHLGSGTAKVRGEFMKGKPASGSSNPASPSGKMTIINTREILTKPAVFGGSCYGVLQPFGNTPELMGNCRELGLIGAPFFYEQYTVFDIAEPSLSYAPYA